MYKINESNRKSFFILLQIPNLDNGYCRGEISFVAYIVLTIFITSNQTKTGFKTKSKHYCQYIL